MARLRDEKGLYAGPIIDAHHHLWDRTMDRHPWLRGQGEGPLSRSCLPEDYLRAADGFNIVASVHVEANWDPADPLGEIAWLDSLERPAGIAARYVGYAALESAEAPAIIEALAAHERATGIRDIVSWHPDPKRSAVADRHRVADPKWRAGLKRLQENDLSFDLQISPWQVADALDLLSGFPDLRFALCHCGSPFDRTEEGLAQWADGLKSLAAAPNLVLKISDLVAYDPDWTEESLRRVLMTCLEAFGPERCMLGSDHPVVTLHATFRQTYDTFRAAFADLTDAESYAMFAGNAAGFYRIPDQPTNLADLT